MSQDVYVDGEWLATAGRRRIEKRDPVTEEVACDVAEGVAADVDVAVAAARRAAAGWAVVAPSDRQRLIGALADEIERRLDEVTDTIVADVGTPRRIARWAQVGLGISDLRNAAAGIDEIGWEQPAGPSLLRREPIGVVGCITPWNYPLHQITAKVGAALAAGCTVVVKPSELATRTAKALVAAIDAVGFPPGVVGVVDGIGPTVGRRLAEHPDVDMVSFTGSGRVGKEVAAAAAGTVKRVALELGGKSASIVLPGADLDAALPGTMRSTFMNGGQSCNALTRLVVPRGQREEIEERAREIAAGYVMGHPHDRATRLGPMVSGPQRDRVLGFVATGREEGAREVTPPVDVPETGYFAPPVVFSDVTPDMAIAQEEIFGPVLSILAYDDVAEAVAIANSTVYGIAGAVWGDHDEAMAVARQMRCAQVEVNGAGFNPAAPFGGYKQSGLGREGGAFGIEECLEVKSIQRALDRPVRPASQPC